MGIIRIMLKNCRLTWKCSVVVSFVKSNYFNHPHPFIIIIHNFFFNFKSRNDTYKRTRSSCTHSFLFHQTENSTPTNFFILTFLTFNKFSPYSSHLHEFPPKNLFALFSMLVVPITNQFLAPNEIETNDGRGNQDTSPILSINAFN